MHWLQLFFPFAAGFFLSYVYRTANAVIAPLIGGELGLGDSALGLLTSTYFLSFALAQLPVGVMLDRYGPRRVEAGLLLVTAVGASIYASAQSLAMLALGRGLIGLGVSACLMAPLKAFALFYPKERLVSLTGWVMVAGSLGAICAATPLDWLLGHTDWRTVCWIGAGVTIAVAALIFFVVPEAPATMVAAGTLREQIRDVRRVFAAPQFRRLAPMAFFFSGGFQALQGLWAARWIAVQTPGPKSAIAAQLSAIGIAALIGMLLVGSLSPALLKRGLKLEHLYRAAMVTALGVIASLLLWPHSAGWLLWPLLGLSCGLNNLAFPLLSQFFPANFAGRANTALNMAILGGAFFLQWGLGAATATFEGNGLAPSAAFRCSFALLLTAQAISLAWLFASSAPLLAARPATS